MVAVTDIALENRAESAEPAPGRCEQFRESFLALGTKNEIIFSAPSRAAADRIRESVREWVTAFEQKYSRFRPDSRISCINRAAGGAWVDVDGQTEELLALCDWYHWKTGGLFDPTVGPLSALWGLPPAPPRSPAADEVAKTLAVVGWKKVQRRPGAVRLPVPGMEIDLGGIGKEYAIDRVFEIVRDAGSRDVLVDFGHDVRVTGSPPEGGPWRIGLENPDEPGTCWSGVALKTGALCGSGNYLRHVERDGQRFGHIVDPRTGRPVANACQAVWVIADTCIEAGALARSAFVAGPEEGLRLIESCMPAAGCLWTSSGVIQTRRFQSHVIHSDR